MRELLELLGVNGPKTFKETLPRKKHFCFIAVMSYMSPTNKTQHSLVDKYNKSFKHDVRTNSNEVICMENDYY